VFSTAANSINGPQASIVETVLDVTSDAKPSIAASVSVALPQCAAGETTHTGQAALDPQNDLLVGYFCSLPAGTIVPSEGGMLVYPLVGNGYAQSPITASSGSPVAGVVFSGNSMYVLTSSQSIPSAYALISGTWSAPSTFNAGLPMETGVTYANPIPYMSASASASAVAYVSNAGSSSIAALSLASGTSAAVANLPSAGLYAGTAVDTVGNLWVAYFPNNFNGSGEVLEVVTAAGAVDVITGIPSLMVGIRFDRAGNLWAIALTNGMNGISGATVFSYSKPTPAQGTLGSPIASFNLGDPDNYIQSKVKH